MENKLIRELDGLKQNFIKTVDKLTTDLKRQNKIMMRSDKRQQKEYDELQRKFIEIEELNAEVESTQREVVFTLGAIGESRSLEMGQHVKRVAEYSYLLAKHYGLPEEECKMLKLASPMHDVGKVAIPDDILNKPGKLNNEEREIMKTHAKLGFNILCHSTCSILITAAIIAHEHHEKYNGTGYPNSLKGEGIHIFGRITALADVFDALSTPRIYKSVWDDKKIFEMLQEERGEHFDPQLIDVFFEYLGDFLLIRDSLQGCN